MIEQQTPAGVLELKERKKLLDAAWLVLLTVLLVAILAPWFFRILEVDVGWIAWSSFGYGAAYVGASTWADRLSTVRALRGALLGLQAANLLFLTALWLMVGGTQTPMFLLAFVLPVIAGGMVLTRWEPFALAGWGVTLVVTAAVASSPSLRWYAERAGVPGTGPLGRLGEALPIGADPFPGADALPAHSAVSLILFAVLLFAVAVATSTLAGIMRRLQGRLETSRQAREDAQELAQRVLESSRDPAALVHRGSRRVVIASRSFVTQLLLRPEDLLERDFFQLVGFSFPEVVEEILDGGEAPYVVYHAGKEARVARVTAAPLRHEGATFSFVTLHDVTDVSHLKRALDTLGPLYILAGMDGRVLYYNAPAADRFVGLHLGAPLDQALAVDDVPAGWWDPGPRRRAERVVAIQGEPHQVQVVTAEVPGEQGRISLLSLSPRGALN